MEETFYLLLSIAAAILGIAAVFVAKKAMQRGLTYYEMNATIYALMIFAVARVWHTVREIFEFDEWAELIEYSMYIVAYVLFIFLARKVFSLAETSKDFCVTPPKDKK